MKSSLHINAYKKIIISRILIFVFICGILNSCNILNPSKGYPPMLTPQAPDPYDSPIWYPDGRFIGFNHSFLYTFTNSSGITYHELNPDSSGFWLIKPDGTDMHRILPYELQTPAWSPDGKWIAFVAGAQIFKMKFNGTGFDTTTLTQLTTQGRNFFPAWSPGGQSIAFSQSVCNGYLSCGVWIVGADGKSPSFIANYGNFPFWNPKSTKLIFVTTAVLNSGTVLGDSVWTYNKQSSSISFLTYLHGRNYDNRYPKYSPDGKTIAFSSQPLNQQVNLWIMDSSGTNLRQLTTEGMSDDSGEPFSWDPTGKFIVFTKYRFDKETPQNGTLWVLDVSTGQQRQLTFNAQ